MVMKAWANVFVVVLCAWVLWTGHTGYRLGSTIHRIQLTHIVGAYESLEVCQDYQDQYVKRMSTLKGATVAPAGNVVYMSEPTVEGRTRTKAGYLYQCLPGTLDPRGGK